MKTTRLAGCLIAGCLAAGSAGAASTSFTTDITFGGDWQFTPGDTLVWHQVAQTDLSTLPQFFPLFFGTLNSAVLTLSGTMGRGTDLEGLDVADEFSPNSMDVTGWGGITTTVPLNGVPTPGQPFKNLPNNAGCSEPDGPSCFASTENNDYISISGTYTGNDLAAFIGPGDLGDITLALLLVTESFATDNVIDPLSWSWIDFNGTATVEYQYDLAAVPLPAAFWFMGSGLLGLLSLGRRRRR